MIDIQNKERIMDRKWSPSEFRRCGQVSIYLSNRMNQHRACAKCQKQRDYYKASTNSPPPRPRVRSYASQILDIVVFHSTPSNNDDVQVTIKQKSKIASPCARGPCNCTMAHNRHVTALVSVALSNRLLHRLASLGQFAERPFVGILAEFQFPTSEAQVG